MKLEDKAGGRVTWTLRCCRRLFCDCGDDQRALTASQSVEQAKINANASARDLQMLCGQKLDDAVEKEETERVWLMDDRNKSY